ncbi:MAG TPA: DUF4292 domain-containing protein [Bryobacteraceae bacterium]|nr:DUF4292 domain-containing protein [Bryobacteraceae bacterium]
MRRILFLMLGIAGLFAAAQTATSAQPAAKTSHTAKTADSFLTGAPFTLDQVIRIVGQDAIPMRRRKEAIQNRGVDFLLSPAMLARLKAAGVPEELMEVIKSKAKPLPPPADSPKPPAEGNLSITCAPAECQVSVNGTPRGETKDGALELDEMQPGSYVVDLTRDGYISRQSTMVVEPDKEASISARLEPTRETQETFGAARFQKMLQALGGEDGLKELSALQAAGSATVLTSDGRTIRWNLRMRTRGDRALFQAASGAVVYEVVFTGHEFATSKNLKGQEALELPTELGFIRDNHVAALLARLNTQQYKMLASDVEPAGSEPALSAESGTAKVSIDLDGDKRPRRVRITTETGVGSLLITYSDYAQVGHAWFPKAIQVKPEGKERGIEVQFDLVELDTKSRESDFRLKGRLFSNLYN